MNKDDKIFSRRFENNVEKTIRKYNILNKKDRVIVACSGGKDSTAVLYILKKLGYKPEALMIDLEIGKWSDENLSNLKHNIEKIDPSIHLHVISPRELFGTSVCYLKSLAKQNAGISSCMVCGVMKKHILNKKARELGMTKIATGHNMDDEAQNLLLNMLKGNPEMCMNLGPITGTIKNSHFVDRIKPLYFTPEKDIRKYSEIMGFKLQYDRCPCSTDGYRKEIRTLLNNLEKTVPKIKENLVKNLIELKRKRPRIESTLGLCEICGEPARNKTCRLCEILETIKSQ